MDKGRCVGLIGGLGVGATVQYYRKLAAAHDDRGVRLDLVMAHAETSQVFGFVEAGDATGLAEYLVGFIHRLAAAGAQAVVIPAVTPHFCIDELTAVSPLPVFNLFDPLLHELRAQQISRVAVFGTRFVMASDLFGKVPGVDFIRPPPDEAEYIHRTYLALVQRGTGSPEEHRSLTQLAQTLCERESLDRIILAGTDLGLLFDETNTDFPALDCAALHLRAITSGLCSSP